MAEKTIRLGILITLLHVSNCTPEAYISDGQTELSGPQCPRVVTFTCNALEFNHDRISWFAGDTVLAEYRYSARDVYPVEFRTNPAVINAKVQILNATFTSGFNYFNFTLSVNLTELVSFRGQNIACGSRSMRSNAISNEFEILSNDFNVKLQLVYMDKTLNAIIAKWNNIFPNCGIIMNYSIVLKNDENQKPTEKELETDACYNNSCIHKIAVMDTATSYFLQITANGIYNMYSNTSEIAGSSTFYINYSVKEENCMVIFNCSSITSEGCLLRFEINEVWQAPININQEMMPSLNLIPLQIYRLEMNTTSRNTQISLITNYTTGPFPHGTDFTAIYGVTLFFFILGFVFLFSGYIIIIIAQWLERIRRKTFCKYVLMLSVLSILLFVTALSLWIAFGVLSHGTCQMKGTVSHNLLIAASVISILLICSSVMVLGGFVLSVGKRSSSKWEKCQSENEDLEMKQIKQTLSFNLIKEEWKKKIEMDKCGECGIEGKDDNFCARCNKRMCNSCYQKCGKVFTGLNLDFYVACPKCYVEYLTENENLKVHSRFIWDVSNELRQTAPNFCESCNSSRTETSDNTTQSAGPNKAQIEEEYDENIQCKYCYSVLCNDAKFCYNKKPRQSNEELVCMLCYIIRKRKEHQFYEQKETSL